MSFQLLGNHCCKMLLSKRNIQISIVLIVMSLALATGFLPPLSQPDILTILRAAQVTVTVFMLFGILKAHPSHKANFFKLWLGITSTFFASLIYIILSYFFSYYPFYEIWEIFVLPISAVGVAYLMSIMYKEFVELTQGSVDALEAKQPPTYDATLQNLVISLKS
ncbi:uncharacterized protein LOC117784326 [Drosophila innubila]|uniref:uncharacterized protein LOC117784326 n=1 Tax=Drosophila innubila TaxID=198719 RepID=UPI00148B363B|nr:uncharacterized protein LOC117784326 [Drosophila innubila]